MTRNAHVELSEPDQRALDAFLSVRPVWRSDGPAGELVNLPRNVLLHAGPPFADFDSIPRPILNSAATMVVFEGLSDDIESALGKIRAGDIRLAAAQDFGVVTPLVQMVSASTPLHEVVDSNAQAENAIRAFAPFNEGPGPATRLGALDARLIAHLQWLKGPLARSLKGARPHRLDLFSVADLALSLGDDCHGRTVEGSAELYRILRPGLDSASSEFLQRSPSFFLNLWMAACKCMMAAAGGIAGSSLVTACGANGVDTGIKISSLPEQWFIARATPPHGNLSSHDPERGLPAIGDSAVVDATGFGAMAITHSPAQMEALGRFMPSDGYYRPAQLFIARHKSFRRVSIHSALFARCAVALGKGPLVALGIIDAYGEAGRLGGGIFDAPVLPYRQAVAALDHSSSNAQQ